MFCQWTRRNISTNKQTSLTSLPYIIGCRPHGDVQNVRYCCRLLSPYACVLNHVPVYPVFWGVPLECCWQTAWAVPAERRGWLAGETFWITLSWSLTTREWQISYFWSALVAEILCWPSAFLVQFLRWMNVEKNKHKMMHGIAREKNAVWLLPKTHLCTTVYYSFRNLSRNSHWLASSRAWKRRGKGKYNKMGYLGRRTWVARGEKRNGKNGALPTDDLVRKAGAAHGNHSTDQPVSVAMARLATQNSPVINSFAYTHIVMLAFQSYI